MKTEIDVDLIVTRLLGADTIQVKIRTRVKVSEEQVAELFSANDFIISYYSEKDIIPKKNSTSLRRYIH
ncbi:hypothetical protein, partial [Pseudomonas syringae group genomosp. 7]|uniref:hypothetical protein n=1 Tax=Pseudomonas syringae group genomosp. 7 TaxID=251699 RepID=UPI00377007D2